MSLQGSESARAAAAMVRQQMQRMADPGPALQRAAAELDALLDASIAQGRSPSGVRWARQKPERTSSTNRRPGSTSRRPGSHPVGQRTGAMRSSITVVVSGKRIVGTISVPYGLFFHAGTRRMPARPLVPVSMRGNPMRRGPAGDWLRAFVAGLARYTVTGRVGA